MNQSQKPKPAYDLLAHLRKPHGILVIALILGVAAWAIWTFVWSARV